MKYEFMGWSIGKHGKVGDETGQFHGIVNLGNGSCGAACNQKRKVSGLVEKELPDNANVCRTCNRIIPIFACIEYHSGFAVRHTRTGKQHWMSDGVDSLFNRNGKAISPGSKGFRAKWEDSLNFNVSETLEAYFPELCNEEEEEAEDNASSFASGSIPRDDADDGYGSNLWTPDYYSEADE